MHGGSEEGSQHCWGSPLAAAAAAVFPVLKWMLPCLLPAWLLSVESSSSRKRQR